MQIYINLGNMQNIVLFNAIILFYFLRDIRDLKNSSNLFEPSFVIEQDVLG
mgnify:CR=1 FL=1|jgi:hypothetical protein